MTRLPRLNGFTLIETLLYAALLTLIMGIFSSVVYNATSSIRKDTDQNNVLANELFLQQKVHSILNTAFTNDISPASGSAAQMGITQQLSEQFGVVTSPVTFDLAGGVVRITRQIGGPGVNETLAVTNNKVTASNLLFTRDTLNGEPIMTMTVTLTGKTTVRNTVKTYYLK